MYKNVLNSLCFIGRKKRRVCWTSWQTDDSMWENPVNIFSCPRSEIWQRQTGLRPDRVPVFTSPCFSLTSVEWTDSRGGPEESATPVHTRSWLCMHIHGFTRHANWCSWWELVILHRIKFCVWIYPAEWVLVISRRIQTCFHILSFCIATQNTQSHPACSNSLNKQNSLVRLQTSNLAFKC